jgi:hypothetical protein
MVLALVNLAVYTVAITLQQIAVIILPVHRKWMASVNMVEWLVMSLCVPVLSHIIYHYALVTMAPRVFVNHNGYTCVRMVAGLKIGLVILTPRVVIPGVRLQVALYQKTWITPIVPVLYP